MKRCRSNGSLMAPASLERNGLIQRQPGVARSIHILVAPEHFPILDWLKINLS